MIGTLHVPGPSPVHAVPAGYKLLVLCGLGTASFVIADPAVIAAGAAVVIMLYPLGRVPLHQVWVQARDLAPLLVLMAVTQAWFDSPLAAALTVTRVLTLVWAAGLVTATTGFSAMMAVLQRILAPLRRFGVRPARIAFALTMTVRFVPLLQEMIQETRAAQAARGMGRNPLALAIPVTIRALRLAEGVAEAVEARGALTDDDDFGIPERRHKEKASDTDA
ncbi:energy-coupling factor transporter transmembrane protein EcfT [Aquisalimonas lutea]|uniref:energy-coupling factor transporter transmembrane component T family protein n=1 Tax=Aquisalimonas lutea TaxID=1327750 RepID=UPI0025B2A858|nr:energy-coupling factor transporter transmembrane protein EcfT [Aquisalimonas lutea]MDN3518524.1 energy-coupling factor transporter transmembrane protein EcfT [Aquisalimonas lutea]